MERMINLIKKTASTAEWQQTNYFLMRLSFGMPSKECRNLGICRIEILNAKDPPDYTFTDKKRCHNCSICILALGIEETLNFIFDQHAIDDAIYRKYLSRNYFTVLEDYAFSPIACDRLNVSDLLIPKGSYPIIRSSSLLQIEFAAL